MTRQRKCRICKKRPPWRYKNCPPGIFKRCYHKHVWDQRPQGKREPEVPLSETWPEMEIWEIEAMNSGGTTELDELSPEEDLFGPEGRLPF